MQRFSRSTSVLSVVVAIVVVSAAGLHQLQWDTAAYRTSLWIPIEIIGLAAAMVMAVPQLGATIYLIWKREESLRWAGVGAVALLLLPASIALAIALDAPTLIYAT